MRKECGKISFMFQIFWHLSATNVYLTTAPAALTNVLFSLHHVSFMRSILHNKRIPKKLQTFQFYESNTEKFQRVPVNHINRTSITALSCLTGASAMCVRGQGSWTCMTLAVSAWPTTSPFTPCSPVRLSCPHFVSCFTFYVMMKHFFLKCTDSLNKRISSFGSHHFQVTSLNCNMDFYQWKENNIKT